MSIDFFSFHSVVLIFVFDYFLIVKKYIFPCSFSIFILRKNHKKYVSEGVCVHPYCVCVWGPYSVGEMSLLCVCRNPYYVSVGYSLFLSDQVVNRYRE